MTRDNTNAAKGEQGNPQEMLMQLRYLQNIYSQEYELVQQSLMQYTNAYNVMQKNIELLGKIKNLKDSRILLNADGGLYIGAELKKLDKFITYVGAGYLVEKTLEEATGFFAESSKNGGEVIKKLVNDGQKIERDLVDIAYKISFLEQGGLQQ